MNRFQNVAIVGAGQIGVGIAQVAAVSGHCVALNDKNEQTLKRAKATIERNLKQDVNIRRMKAADQKGAIANTLSKIKMSCDLLECVGDAHLVVEAVDEDLKVKQSLFAELERLVSPESILAHHSQSLTIEQISQRMTHRENFGGVQFYAPVHVSKMVKIIKCISTSQSTFEALDQFGTQMGKETVRCIDTPDFIIEHGARQSKKTRLLIPYMMEALREIEKGNLSAKAIDEVMKKESDLPLGPFELLDYIGLDTAQFVIAGWHKAYPHEEKYNPSAIIDTMVNSGTLGRKTGTGFYEY